MPERARFLRGMVSWAGFRQVPLHYARAARQAGDSKYPLRKMVHFAMDGIISFSLVPLKIAIWTGFLAIWIAVAGIIVAIVDRLLNKQPARLGLAFCRRAVYGRRATRLTRHSR
jgi:dolichol-phosphate mannosyltransferase